MHRLLGQFARFGIVGGVGLVVDLGLFNVLLATVLAPERVHEGPVLAKAISSAVAIVCNWIGNRYWTFRRHRGRQLWREGVEFGAVSIAGMLIGVACLWVSHYLLGFESRLADNIAGNGVGLVLGTVFRFTLYKLWVFRPHRGEQPTGFEEPADSAGESAPPPAGPVDALGAPTAPRTPPSDAAAPRAAAR